MAAVGRRKATQFLTTSWRPRGFGPNVVSSMSAVPSIATAHRHCQNQQGWMSSLAEVEESTSVLYPPTSSCTFRSSTDYADNDRQPGRRRRWLSTRRLGDSSSSSSSFSSSSSSISPPSAALLLHCLPTQGRGSLPLFSSSPSIACDRRGGPLGLQARRHGDGGNRLIVEPRVVFSLRSLFCGHGERGHLPSMYLTRSSDGLSHHPSSSSSLSSLSRGISSRAWTPSLVSLRIVQSVVDGGVGISSSTCPASFSSLTSSVSLSSSLCSSYSSSSSSSLSADGGGGTVSGFETPILEEDSTVGSSSSSQVSVDDVNKKVIGGEGEDLSARTEELRMSGSAAADRDLDGGNLDNGSEETSVAINQQPETDEAAEIGYSLIGKIDVTDEAYPLKPKSLFAVVQVGSHQFKVTPGDVIYTEKLKIADVNDKIALEKVLLLGSVSKTIIGRPTIPGALVRAAVEEQALDAKVIIFKKKRRKNYRRTRGHRQMLSRLRILEIAGIEEDASASAGVQNLHEPESCDSQQEAAAVAAA